MGGLNLGSLNSKNLALLGKWWWRFKIVTNSLWVRVIRSIFGPDGGLGSGGESSRAQASVWSNVIKAGTHLEEIDIPFKSSFCRIVRDGSNTAFWDDFWIGENKLRILFPRLFMLEQHKEALVTDRIVISENNLSTSFMWLRSPSGRTETELKALLELLGNYNFVQGNTDTWRWILANNGIFTVKKLNDLIDEKCLLHQVPSHETLRNNLVPKKLEIFVWRALKKRLPVRMELDKRCIDLHSVRYPLCDDDLETVDHIFIFCKHSLEIWDRVFHWWGLGNFSNFSMNEILKGNAPVSMSTLGGKL
ncbi:uncharacterized protein [Rutidosis leptorrhynchoides]|uniref:uncharacterized protein n=1 Tax=Rutidosis leptorrhynchoides TaxID=125765 RepID=UPI003A98D167